MGTEKTLDTFEKSAIGETKPVPPPPSRGHPLNLPVRSAHREDLVGGSSSLLGLAREGDRHDENARDLDPQLLRRLFI